MFIEANTDYAIQMNRGGSSQPYHTSLIRSAYPHASNIAQEDVRFCSAFSRDPVACINQVTSHLQTPAAHRWPFSAESSWTRSVREHYGQPEKLHWHASDKGVQKKTSESYQRNLLRDYAGNYNLRHLQQNLGLLPP